MDALDVAKVWFRRWYLTLPVLLLAVSAGVGLAKNQAAEYHASATFALIYSDSTPRPANAPDPREQNPLALNDGTLLGQALMAALQTPAEQRTLGGTGNSGTAPGQPTDGSSFAVTLPLGSLTYTVDTWGPDRQQVRTVVERVLKNTSTLSEVLQDRAGAPPKSRYTPFVTTPTQVSTLPAPSSAKLLVGFAAVGVAGGAALALVLDRLLVRRAERRRRRQAKAQADGSPGARPKVPVGAPESRWGRRRPTPQADSDSDAMTARWGDQDEFWVGRARSNGGAR